MNDAKATDGPSPSSGRIAGDDLQHLIAWYWCLKACAPRSSIEAVGIEVDGAGNLDDVRVMLTGDRQRYLQVKASTSATGLVNVDWLTDTSRSKKSLIQRLHSSWVALGRPSDGVGLITSRPIDPNDALLAERDRLNRLGPRVRRATETKITNPRAELATHVGCGETELCDFLDVLEVQLGQTEADWRDKVDDAALGAGVSAGDNARAIGVSEIREWVKTTRSVRTAQQLRERINALKLQTGAARAVVVVEALDHVPGAPDATIHLDWVSHFRGDSARTRRGTVDLGDWNGKLAADLAGARDRLKAAGQLSVAVRGAMRLPTWFAVGAAFSDVAAFDVAAIDRGALWHTEAASTDGGRVVRVLVDDTLSGPAGQTALVVEISNTATEDVRAALDSTVGRIISVTLDGGPDRRLLEDGPDAFAGALAVRDWVRHTLQGNQIHLVLVANGPFALFLGHLWDRVPPTTIYEDLAPGYEAAFFFRN